MDKMTLMVGEKAVLRLAFCYDNLEEYTLEEPQLQYFNVTPLSEDETQESHHISCVTQRYAFMAKKAGDFTLPRFKAHIEYIPLAYQERYNKNHYLQKIDIFTKPLSLHVSPLPHGLRVSGVYHLVASLDKTEVDAQKPLHFTVELKGEGNVENIDFLALNIPHALVYPHKTNTRSKTFDIVSDENYTIPAISLTYFNQAHQMVEITHTEAYQITVLSSSVKKSKSTWVLVFIILVYLCLFFYLYTVFRQIAWVDEKQMLAKRINKAKSKKELLKVIAPYMHKSKALERLVYRLEESEERAFKGLKKETTTQMRLLTQNSNKFI